MVKKYFEHVGSFLRPEELKVARQQFDNGDISKEALKEVEDKAIIELVNKQVAAGLDKITDGEFRRSYWHLDNFWDSMVYQMRILVVVTYFTMKKLEMIPLFCVRH
ncbi:methionine synthase II (cobalamin-independent) [Streptococcus agalactiae]|nr:methionine synthase II (cobalamin-independent) [Streptococcus agalactiae]CCW40240.1 Methionine synthase II (cobalamin-independent) [Streptococcus agalactiae ILRI005]